MYTTYIKFTSESSIKTNKIISAVNKVVMNTQNNISVVRHQKKFLLIKKEMGQCTSKP